MSSVFDLVKTKRAVRRYTSEPLADDAVRQILEAGRLSGSAKNMQPWHFIAVRSGETLASLAECGAYAAHLAGAAMVVALVTADPYLRLSVPFDLGRAAQNMMLTAWSLGVGSEMATIYRADQARELLNVPAEYTIPWCIAFGYPAEATDHPARKGGRLPAERIIHYERW